jgi:alpha-glucosidase
MLNFAAIFQIPMVGSDVSEHRHTHTHTPVYLAFYELATTQGEQTNRTHHQVCGFLGDANEKLCARWATLGAFNPFYRNHADAPSPPQEFYRWPLVASAARHAISVRYQLLDYLYTALARQSRDGTPALSPLWFAYPEDEATFDIDAQFLFGDCVLVSPVVDDDAADATVYLPDDILYDWDTRRPLRGRGAWVTIYDVPFDRIPIHVRGGCIVPLRRAQGANTTTELRDRPFELLVAPGVDGTAAGSLYVDDGLSLDGGPDRREVKFRYDPEAGLAMESEGGAAMDLARLGINVEEVTIMGQDEEIGNSDLENDEEL